MEPLNDSAHLAAALADLSRSLREAARAAGRASAALWQADDDFTPVPVDITDTLNDDN